MQSTEKVPFDLEAIRRGLNEWFDSDLPTPTYVHVSAALLGQVDRLSAALTAERDRADRAEARIGEALAELAEINIEEYAMESASVSDVVHVLLDESQATA